MNLTLQQPTDLTYQPYPKKVIPLTGKWIPAYEGVDLGLNYKQLTNLRYTDTHLKGVAGMTKINSVAMHDTYQKVRSAFHYTKSQPEESHLLVQAYNSDLSASVLLQNKTAIPNAGSFEKETLWTDAAGAGRGYFSIAPSETLVYCNGKENLIWGGDEAKVGGFFIANPDSQVIYDYTAQVQNTMTDAQNVATMTTTGGGIDEYAMVVLHGENDATDSSGNDHDFTFNGTYSTTSPKFGTYAFSFNGSTQYMYCADHADFDQSGGVWSIDTWVYYNSFNAVSTIWSLATDANNYNRLYVNTSGIVIYNLVVSGSEKSTIASGIGSIELGRWHHIEMTENGDDYYLFIDGVKVASQNAADRPADYSSYFSIGAFHNGSTAAAFSPFLLDEFRLSVGVARHTAGFAPQASAYSTSSSSTLYIIATRPLQGAKFYVETANESVASVASDYWTGSGYSLTAAPIDYMEYATDEAAQAAYVSSETSSDVTLDYMEYANDAVAQAAYVSSSGGSVVDIDYMEYADDAAAQAAYVSNSSANLQSYSESTIKTQGSYSLKGVATITDSLNKTLTKDLTGALDGTGGTITHAGGYTIHTFTSSGTFNPGFTRTVEYLVVAGGAGGGSASSAYGSGGGGGAGGMKTGSVELALGTHAITVGLGGAGGADASPAANNGANGGDSSIGTEVTAHGGGYGAGAHATATAGNAGGSGGGGAGSASGGAAGGAGTSGEGNDGGPGTSAYNGGGGGGAGGAGVQNTPGAGQSSSISGAAVTYAAGGQAWNNAPAVDPQPGAANTGNGGEAGTNYAGQREGKAGGSGIVIIRYPTVYIDLTGQDTASFDLRSSRTGSNIKVAIHDVGGTTTEITPNITGADSFQTVTWDLSGIADADKNQIDSIIITIVNADAANTFYFDNFFAGELPVLQCYSEATAKTQGSYALKAQAVITDSLNETLTRDISSPIDLTGVETLKFDIRASRMGINLTIAIHDSGGTWTEISPNILAVDTYQTVTWDISSVADADKDAIDKIRVTVINATAANTFYIDNFYAEGPPISLQSYSEGTIITQGSYALKGIAAITASLSKTLTKTIASPIDLTGVSTIGFDIRASRTGENITLAIHDSGGTWTSITPDVLVADTYQSVIWDISGVADADKNAIDSVRITVANADAENTFYIDNLGPAGGALYDGTATDGGTKTLGQTGLISFGSTTGLAKPKMYNGLVGYLYRFTFTGIDATTTISHVTVDAPIQPLVDLWDGADRECMAFYVYKNSTYNDYTLNVYENEYDSSDESSYVELDSLATGTNKLYFASYERLMGINVGLVGGHVNTTAATAVTIRYSNDGANFITVGTVDDGTAEGGISFSKSGTITWNPPASSGEFMSKVSKITPRYHYEISFDKTLSADVQLFYLSGIPVQRTFGQYKFPLMAQDMLFLCCDMANKKHAAIHSEYQTTQIFNGVNSTEIEFGETGELTCGASLYNLYGYNLYNLIIFFKDTEMWKLSGNFPDWQRHQVSDKVGCPAPLTLKTVSLPGDIPQGLSRNVIIWQGSDGVYVSDGRAPLPVHGDIENYFDPTKPAYIKPELIGESWADLDQTKMEYHLHVASGATATVPDTELVFDLKRWKWYLIDRGTGKRLVAGTEAKDIHGNKYNYGFIDSGYMLRLENGTSFDGNDIVHRLGLGDLVFSENDFTMETRVERLELVTVKKSVTSNNITYTHYVDTDPVGTSFALIPTASNRRVATIVRPIDSKVGVFHSGLFEMTTNNEVTGFEPLALAYAYSPQYEKMTN